MTPLSHFAAADDACEDFTPLMALAKRRAQTVAARAPFAKSAPLKVLPRPVAAPAPAAAAAPAPAPVRVAAAPAPVAAPALPPPAPAPAAPRLVTEPRVPLRQLEAERQSFAQEREAFAAEREAFAAERDATAAAHAAALDAARAQAATEARGLARAAMDAELAIRLDAQASRLGQAHAEELATVRGVWTEQQADRLADLMILQLAILEQTVKLSLGNVLKPLALDARRRQTVDEIVGAVRTVALDGASYRVVASGPADLLGAVRSRLGEDAKLLAFAPDETKSDIRIDADATVIESRLSSWRSALEEALS